MNYSFCFCRAEKSKALGARKEIPTLMEIEALKRGGCVQIKVYFSDKKFLFCRVDSWTTFRNLHEAVSKALYLHRKNEGLFCFYEVNESRHTERVPGPEDRVLDLLARWEQMALAESANTCTGATQSILTTLVFFVMQRLQQ
jgi:hypothetical protein